MNINSQYTLDDISLDIASLHQHYRQGDFSPEELMSALIKKRDAINDNPIWISVLSENTVLSSLSVLEGKSPDDLPLYGIPFAIKDNIDLAGTPTTAACKEFSYTPEENAFVVDCLVNAGAIPLGKTNLDQFATGLVGVRSPWGACKNAFNPEVISGGSSSGSAVATALGLVSFALGTDTAGSGRVPATLNNLVGLKPSRGVLSTRGVVPACRSLDCVSIFSLTAPDANVILDCTAVYDAKDPYSRQNRHANGARYFSSEVIPQTVGVPLKSQLQFFGDEEAQTLYEQAIDLWRANGATIQEIDFSAFLDAAKLLYEGPWVAERYIACESIIEQQPDAMLPVTRSIIEKGKLSTAVDAFKAEYRLRELKTKAFAILDSVDVVMTPTIGTFYSIDDLNKDPITLNSNLGFYTNFMNLLDCSAVAAPVGFYSHGLPFGVTYFTKAFGDKYLLSMAEYFSRQVMLPLGAGKNIPSRSSKNSLSPSATIEVAVCGAHLDGYPLNWQLAERGAKLQEATLTSPNYSLYALAGGPVKRPALVRNINGGVSIEVEVWAVPKEHFGSFVAEIPAPLGIGKLELEDGRWVSGFICDGFGLEGAEDISSYGGWRSYCESR